MTGWGSEEVAYAMETPGEYSEEDYETDCEEALDAINEVTDKFKHLISEVSITWKKFEEVKEAKA